MKFLYFVRISVIRGLLRQLREGENSENDEYV